MNESGMGKLLSLLFDEARELVNVKFFPGTDRGLTADQLSEAAAEALKAVLAGPLHDAPPVSGRAKSSLMGAVSAIK